jgi:sugar phosphate isomerase/epimerase
VFVAASTDCFSSLPLDAALQKLVDLEYTRVEICIHEDGNHLKPSEVHANLEAALTTCRKTHRLTPVAYSVDIQAPESEYYQQFSSCCKLAKATKVGTPFNAEVERLRELVRIATAEAVSVGLKTQVGRMTQDPATAAVLCDNVKGLCISLDPSHYVYGPLSGVDYDGLMKYVCHVQLRDTTKNKLQVRVGQGAVEYGRLISQLSRFRYNRALCVNVIETDNEAEGVDHMAEMRKMRLLLESLI